MGTQLNHVDLGVVFCILFLVTTVMWLGVGIVKHVSYFVMRWWANG